MREIEPRPAQCVLNRPAPPHTHDTQRMPQTNKTQNQKALLVLKSLHTAIKRQRLVFLHTSARHHSETAFWPKFTGVHKEGKIKKAGFNCLWAIGQLLSYTKETLRWFANGNLASKHLCQPFWRLEL